MPYPLRDHRRALDRFGVSVDKFGGRHPYKAHRGGKGKWPIAVHSLRDELDDRYVAQMCAQFGIDVGLYWAELRGETEDDEASA